MLEHSLRLSSRTTHLLIIYYFWEKKGEKKTMRNPIKTNMVKDVSEPLVFCPLTLCVSRQRCNTFSDEKRDHQTNLINIESQHPCLVLNRVYVIQIGSLREITLSFVETIVTKRMKLMCKRYRTEVVWPINVLPNVSVKKKYTPHTSARAHASTSSHSSQRRFHGLPFFPSIPTQCTTLGAPIDRLTCCKIHFPDWSRISQRLFNGA